MNHLELKEKLLKAMGGKVPISARGTWGYFLTSKNSCYFMNWDWIQDKRIEQWAENHPDLNCWCSSNGLTIEIVHHGKVGHAR